VKVGENDRAESRAMSYAAADSPFLRACRREAVAHTPVWLMRQAGRYLPEYRSIREKLTFLELCTRSEIAAEVTAGTVRRLGVDAAIVFADILLPLVPMHLGLSYEKGDGPRVASPIRLAADVAKLPKVDVDESLAYVGETIRLTRGDLGTATPIIGFAGAPFTVASYAIEGGSSRNYTHVKTMMYREPKTWDALMHYVVDMTVAYLNMQIEAGADAVQLFDSWVGCLSRSDYDTYVQPHVKRLVSRIRPGTPVILFGTATESLLESERDTGAGIVGLDWRVDLASTWERIGHDVAIQGNLDPVVLFADRAYVVDQTRKVLDAAAGRPGHIFNLGHGILPETPVDNVLALVDAVHTYERK
jgi:uroporphyrinogen decarboxylase